MKTNAKAVMARLQKKIQTAMSDAPVILGAAGTKLFVSSFDKQGFGDNTTVDHWKPRKKETKHTKQYKTVNQTVYGRSEGFGRSSKQTVNIGGYLSTRKILSGRTGRLKKSVNNSLRITSKSKLVWSVYLPYAAVHNSGLRSGRGKGFLMPKRTFMQGGYILKKMLLKKYSQILKQAISLR